MKSWTPNMKSWRTFDALELRSDGDLETLERKVRSELKYNEYPAMIKKLRIVLAEKERRDDEHAGRSPSQLRERAVRALERIAAHLEKIDSSSTDAALGEIATALGHLESLHDVSDALNDMSVVLDSLESLGDVSGSVDEIRDVLLEIRN